MLAKSSRPFNSNDYIFELKWDGTRCIAFISEKGVRLQNRRLRDITYRYPEFWGLRVSSGSAVLDGELVVLDSGVPKFSLLQRREHIVDEGRILSMSKSLPAAYIAFDLLELKGKSLMSEPLSKRRELLASLFPIAPNAVLSEGYGSGKRLFGLAIKKGFEGIMAKEKSGSYLPGKRTAHWLKIKKTADVDAVVLGYLVGEGSRRGSFGSLILGLYDHGKPVIIGRAGSGFDEHSLKDIAGKLKKLKAKAPAISPVPSFHRPAVWVRPELVARVSYQEWTSDRHLRVPVFKGLREDKDPMECVFEE